MFLLFYYNISIFQIILSIISMYNILQICRNCADCGREVPLLQITSGSILPFVLCGECHSLRLKGIGDIDLKYNRVYSTKYVKALGFTLQLGILKV